jgi:four helix bundle protein
MRPGIFSFFSDKEIKAMNKKDLENKLVDFAVGISDWIIQMPKHPTVLLLRDQIIRSSSSAALNYGEAQSASSRKDFIHKISIVMKELRETQVNLTIISRLKDLKRDEKIFNLMKENDQLLAIFFRTLQTARSNLHKPEK